MTRLPPLWVPFAQTAGLVGLCVVLFMLVRRGRWVPWNHPVCAGRGFNLFGLPETSGRCPECGEELERVRRMGVWRRRWMSLGVAGVLAVATLWVMKEHLWRGQLPQVLPYLPTWVVQWQAGNPSNAWWAIGELTDRARRGRLSDREYAAAVEGVVALQAKWGGRVVVGKELLRDGRAAGKVSDAVWGKYAANAVRMYPTRVRPVLARGEPVTVELISGTTESGEEGQFVMRVRPTVRLGDDVMVRDGAGPAIELSAGLYQGGVTRLELDIPAGEVGKVKDGPQVVTVTTDIEVAEAGRAGGPEVVVWKERRVEKLPVIVQPAGQGPVTIVDPGTWSAVDLDRLRADVAPKAVFLDGRAPEFERIEPGPRGVWASPPVRGVDHVYRVFVREEGREQELGVLFFSQQDQRWVAAEKMPVVRGERVDVVLKPAVEEAARTVGILKILGGDVVVRDVPVKRDGIGGVPR